MPTAEPALCVVLHDVAPQTWHLYQPFVTLADGLGIPLTLLVVPDYHHEARSRVAATDESTPPERPTKTVFFICIPVTLPPLPLYLK